MTAEVTRRTMLRGLGAALALPWMESLPAVARAATGSAKPPVRMCFWYVPNGVHLPAWFPQQAAPVDLLRKRFRLPELAMSTRDPFAMGLTHNTALPTAITEDAATARSASFLPAAGFMATRKMPFASAVSGPTSLCHVGNATAFQPRPIWKWSSGNASGYSGDG